MCPRNKSDLGDTLSWKLLIKHWLKSFWLFIQKQTRIAIVKFFTLNANAVTVNISLVVNDVFYGIGSPQSSPIDNLRKFWKAEKTLTSHANVLKSSQSHEIWTFSRFKIETAKNEQILQSFSRSQKIMKCWEGYSHSMSNKINEIELEELNFWKVKNKEDKLIIIFPILVLQNRWCRTKLKNFVN